jgi:glycerol transport system ATP-binding protein
MASITLKHVGHCYTPSAYALQPEDIHFDGSKTYALLGPSGCGKTTMLNIISGLVTPSEGTVWFDNREVTPVSTAKRNIAQVFQFPAIYQSKTVSENLAFPLQCRKYPAVRIRQRVSEVAGILGLTERLGRSARSLSADEKQLISLGRGLVRDDVAAILMDEPLTVIDPQLKFELRRKIKQANEQTRLTVIYVTHDQNEAMSIADEVLVMDDGRVVQRGTPSQLFEYPLNTYVGNFIGSPGMNFIPLEWRSGELLLGGKALVGVPASVLAQADRGRTISLGARPEHMSFCTADTPGGFPVSVRATQDQGRVLIAEVDLAGHVVRIKVTRGAGAPSGPAWIRIAPADRRFYADGCLLDGAQPGSDR